MAKKVPNRQVLDSTVGSSNVADYYAPEGQSMAYPGTLKGIEPEEPKDVSLDMQPLELQGEISAPPAEAPPVEPPPVDGEKDTGFNLGAHERRALARFGAGASPALLGFLFGGQPRQVSREIAEGQKFYKDGTPTKYINTVGPNGEPIATPTGEAADLRVWQKPEKLTASAAGGRFAAKTLKDIDPNSPTFGEVTTGFQVGDHYERQGGGILPSSFVAFREDKLSSAPTVSGGKVTYARDPYNGKITTAISTAGIGDVAVRGTKSAPMTKQEAEARIGSAKKGKEVIAKADEDISTLNNSKTELGLTKDPMVFSTAIGKLMRATVGENRLSDEEQKKFMGSDYKSILTRGTEWFTGRGLGEVPDSVRENAVRLADYAIQKANANKIAASKKYGDVVGMGPQGKKMIQSVSGTQDEPIDKKPAISLKSKYGF